MSTCDSAEPSSRNSGFRDGRDPVGRYLAALRPVYLLSRPYRWASASTQDRFQQRNSPPTLPQRGSGPTPNRGTVDTPPPPLCRHPVTRSPGPREQEKTGKRRQAAQRPRGARDRGPRRPPAPLTASDVLPPHAGPCWCRAATTGHVHFGHGRHSPGDNPCPLARNAPVYPPRRSQTGRHSPDKINHAIAAHLLAYWKNEGASGSGRTRKEWSACPPSQPKEHSDGHRFSRLTPAGHGQRDIRNTSLDRSLPDRIGTSRPLHRSNGQRHPSTI